MRAAVILLPGPQVPLLQPFDVVRTRMQADAMSGNYRSTIGTLRLVAAETGVISLWRGTSATVLRLALGAGTHFFVLEELKPLFAKLQPDGSSKLSTFGAAATGRGFRVGRGI